MQRLWLDKCVIKVNDKVDFHHMHRDHPRLREAPEETGTKSIDHKEHPSEEAEVVGGVPADWTSLKVAEGHRYQQQQGCVIVSPTTKNRQGRGPRAQSARALSTTDPRIQSGFQKHL